MRIQVDASDLAQLPSGRKLRWLIEAHPTSMEVVSRMGTWGSATGGRTAKLRDMSSP